MSVYYYYCLLPIASTETSLSSGFISSVWEEEIRDIERSERRERSDERKKI